MDYCALMQTIVMMHIKKEDRVAISAPACDDVGLGEFSEIVVPLSCQNTNRCFVPLETSAYLSNQRRAN